MDNIYRSGDEDDNTGMSEGVMLHTPSFHTKIKSRSDYDRMFDGIGEALVANSATTGENHYFPFTEITGDTLRCKRSDAYGYVM